MENKHKVLNDECIKIFLNAELWEQETNVEIRSFMNYFYESQVTDELSNEIENKVANAINAIIANIPLETIAKICELPLEKVQELAKEVQK